MEAQARYAQISQVTALAVLAASLVIGAIGGYAVRGLGIEVGGSQVAPATTTTTVTPVPRTLREGDETTPYMAPAPRWTHEDGEAAK